jgi:hypothetical protein
MTRVCAECGAVVARRDCHKNRYGEYLCRACLKAGIRSTARGRARSLTRRAAGTGLRWLVYAGLALLLVGGFWVILDHMANPAPPAAAAE